MSKITLLNGNSLELMKDIPTGSIDMILTDPPYKVTSRGNSGTMGGITKDPLFMKGKVFRRNDVQIEDYISELYRVLKESGHCYIFCNQKIFITF